MNCRNCDGKVYKIRFLISSKKYSFNRWIVKEICDDRKKCGYEFTNDPLFVQPERSKREDSHTCEMRCSEHCSNTVREAQ